MTELSEMYDETFWTVGRGHSYLDDRYHKVEAELMMDLFNLKGKRVLDIGCGFGHHINHLNRLVAQAEGIDGSDFCCNGRPIIHQDITRKWKCNTNHDMVMSIHTLEHLSQVALGVVLGYVIYDLIKDGIFLVVVPTKGLSEGCGLLDSTHQIIEDSTWWITSLQSSGLYYDKEASREFARRSPHVRDWPSLVVVLRSKE